MLIYTVSAQWGEYLVFVASKRFPDDTALVAVFKTEDAANEYAECMTRQAARTI